MKEYFHHSFIWLNDYLINLLLYKLLKNNENTLYFFSEREVTFSDCFFIPTKSQKPQIFHFLSEMTAKKKNQVIVFVICLFTIFQQFVV